MLGGDFCKVLVWWDILGIFQSTKRKCSQECFFGKKAYYKVNTFAKSRSFEFLMKVNFAFHCQLNDWCEHMITFLRVFVSTTLKNFHQL